MRAWRMARTTERPGGLLLVLLLSAAEVRGGAGDGSRPPDRDKVAAVEAGRLATARASWWGFDPADATDSLQAALDSAARRVIVDHVGRPWIVRTIRLPSNKEIVLEPGVVVEAKRGEFRGKSDCLMVASGCRRLTLRGQGATLRMHKADYHRPPYEPAEWRHALSLRGCQDVLIEGLTLAESGGDGIYLGAGRQGETNRNVTIRNVVCDGNNRQGVSVITAENLLIEDCVFRNTRGTAPQAGIDFEPNRAQERLVNCVLRRCRSENNAGHAYHVYLGNLHRGSTPVSIRLEQCESHGCQRYGAYIGVANREGRRSVRGSIQYVDCRFDKDAGGGVYVRGNEADGCQVRLVRCTIVRPADDSSRLAPITVAAPQWPDVDAGGVALEQCVVDDPAARRPLAIHATALTRVRNLTGSIMHRTPTGVRQYVLDQALLEQWFPQLTRAARLPRFPFHWPAALPPPQSSQPLSAGLPIAVRRRAQLLVWSRPEHPCVLETSITPVGRASPGPGVLQLAAPNRPPRTLSPERSSDGRWIYRFVSDAVGPLLVQWEGDSNAALKVQRCSAPCSLLLPPTGANLLRPTGTLYFLVPAGATQFGLVVAGSGESETVQAAVVNQAGDVVDQQDNIAAPRLFVVKRAATAADEVWSLRLDRASRGVLEDVTVQLIGAPPLLASSPEQLLRPGN